MSTVDVLEWLKSTFPALHETAEIDRAWVWITANLQGESNRATRDAIKAQGFRWKKGGHALPSGKIGTWGHHCQRPMPFKRRGERRNDSTTTSQPAETSSLSDEELLAQIGL